MTGLVEIAPKVWLRRRSTERLALQHHAGFVRGTEGSEPPVMFTVTRSRQ